MSPGSRAREPRFSASRLNGHRSSPPTFSRPDRWFVTIPTSWDWFCACSQRVKAQMAGLRRSERRERRRNGNPRSCLDERLKWERRPRIVTRRRAGGPPGSGLQRGSLPVLSGDRAQASFPSGPTLPPAAGRPETPVRANAQINPVLAPKLFSCLWLCLRETDVIGWYREDRVAALS